MNWSRLPSLAALRAFEAAARCKSFSNAARELNVTHAAVAQHVRNLEAEFSESLLYRQGRGLGLTMAGEQLAEQLRGGFEQIADGVEQMRARTEARPLNISATPAFAANWLMPRIGEFWSNHPDVALNINPSVGLVDLVRDGFDLAFRFGDGDWPGLDTEPLTNGDFWVVAHPELVAGRAGACLSDLSDLPWVLETYMLERRAIVEKEGVDFESVNVTLLSTSDLVISAAIAGLGLAVQPKSLVEKEIRIGRLAKLCEINQKGLGYYMVTIPGRDPTGLRAFRSWARKSATAGDASSAG